MCCCFVVCGVVVFVWLLLSFGVLCGCLVVLSGVWRVYHLFVVFVVVFYCGLLVWYLGGAFWDPFFRPPRVGF